MTIAATLTVDVRLRWWMRPALWVATTLVRAGGAVASFAVAHGCATRVH